MGIESRHADLRAWKEVVRKFKEPKASVRIGVVGKYMELTDSYKSVWEALYHGGIANEAAVEIVKIDSAQARGAARARTSTRSSAGSTASSCPAATASAAPPAWSAAARWAREHKVPYFGICLGLQIMVIESRAQCPWLGGRRLHRVQPRLRPPRREPPRGPGRREELRRHPAPREERVRPQGGQPHPLDLRRRAHPRSGTATATRSPTPSAPTSRSRAS